MTEPAFLALYARTAGPLIRYLRRLTGDASSAEDLLQDAFIRLLSTPRLPSDEEHQKNYLFRIATNLARDHFRQARRRHAIDAAPRVDAAHVPATRSYDPGDHRDMTRLLARVSPRDRELLLLAYVEGMTHEEIAAITGLMRASIRPLLFRARRRFAAVLREAGVHGAREVLS